MQREDGSINSVNNPVWDNRYQKRDWGLYRGVIRNVIFIDDDNNSSGGQSTPNEVLYDVMIIGGDRDGQIFGNARLMRSLGGHSNFEEKTLKKVEGLTKLDPANTLALIDFPIAEMSKWNGDTVYIQFLNGDSMMPVIVGHAFHQAAEPEAAESDGPRYRWKYNGIYKAITKDGEFTWSKDNGAYLPVSPNTSNPLYPFVSQFAALPSQEQAVKVTLGNNYDFKFEYLLGLNVVIDGVADEFGFSTTTGASIKLTGLETDSLIVTTVLGTTLKVEGGTTDGLTLGTAAGTLLTVLGGSDDAITLKAAFGDMLSVSAKDGIQATTPTGTSLSMKTGQVDIKSGGGAFLTLDKTGFVKLGNAGGDVLKDILAELIKSMSTATYAGFGAPGSNVADFIQLMVKLQLITG